MSKWKRTARAFTLVELMIVVAIIGVLAALSIYGVRKYLASAKTAEAKNGLGGIARAALSSYERETAPAALLAEGSPSTGTTHDFCHAQPAGDGSSNYVPGSFNQVKAKKYQPNSAEGVDFNVGDTTWGWRCLKFQITQPTYYVWSYQWNGKNFNGPLADQLCATQPCFTARAAGDLDGDGMISQFGIGGNVKNGQAKTATQIYIEDELE